MKPDWTYRNLKLYRGNAIEIAPQLGFNVSAVIADPPYGIDYVLNWQKTHGLDRFPPMEGNDQEFDPRPWLKYPTVLLWGANNYTRYLPRAGWLCWDKRCNIGKADKMFGSPFEMAWFRDKERDKIFKFARIQHGGVVNADGWGIKRVHPTQKPIKLLEWCLEMARNPDVVLDPYMGSGTTGLACINADRKFVGIEISQKYFDGAVERIEKRLEAGPAGESITDFEKEKN